MAKLSSRRRRKEQKKGSSGPRGQVVRLPRKGGRKDAAVLQLVEFNITWEALPDPAVEALPEKIKELKDRVYHLMQVDARLVEEELKYLVALHPEIPCFQNWQVKCLVETGREEAGRALARRILKRHPEYFSGRVMAAQFALWDDDLDEADRLLGFPKHPRGIAPDRTLFHISEFMSYMHVSGQFFLMKGKWEAALKCLEVMEDLEPEQQSTRHLAELCEKANVIAAEEAARFLKTG